MTYPWTSLPPVRYWGNLLGAPIESYSPRLYAWWEYNQYLGPVAVALAALAIGAAAVASMRRIIVCACVPWRSRRCSSR